MFYVRQAFPSLSTSVSGRMVVAGARDHPAGKLFDPYDGSRAGAANKTCS